MSKRTCSVNGCGRVSRAKGWCQKHYYALREDKCGARDCKQPLRAKGLCAYHYRLADERNRNCQECGRPFTGDIRRLFCSYDCKYLGTTLPFRRAVDSGDPAKILQAAAESSKQLDTGCWNWLHAINRGTGYPVIGQGGRAGYVHRHIMAAKLGRPIGRESVPHKCANRICINPDHLQLVTQRENIAEMFERNYYLGRIAALESALREVCPDHPLLHGAPVQTALL